MINIFEPITAGIVVALFNRYVLNGSWWCDANMVTKCADDCDSSSSETTTAVNTDADYTPRRGPRVLKSQGVVKCHTS